TLSRTWTRSPCASINGHEKHWDLKLRRINCKPVLHRPLETTPVLDIYPEADQFTVPELTRSAAPQWGPHAWHVVQEYNKRRARRPSGQSQRQRMSKDPSR